MENQHKRAKRKIKGLKRQYEKTPRKEKKQWKQEGNKKKKKELKGEKKKLCVKYVPRVTKSKYEGNQKKEHRGKKGAKREGKGKTGCGTYTSILGE